MQKLHVRFSKPLRWAVLIAATDLGDARTSNLGDSNLDSATEKNSQVIQTANPDPAISRAVADQKMIGLLNSIERHIGQYQQNRIELQNQFQQLAIDLAMETAATILKYEVGNSRQRIQVVLEQWMAEHPSQSSFVVHLNSADLESLTATLSEGTTPLGSKLQLKRDETISIGDCRIESDEHFVTASWRQHLSDIQLSLMESLQDARLEHESTS